MARIRTIKPEFFTSLTVASLPVETRLTFIGLWTHVDDEGRCVDDARLIKAAVWPLDDRVASDVENDLRALTESSLIARYTVNGRSYLAVQNWAEHQRINRPTPSKLPAPSEGQTRTTPALEPPLTSGNDALTEPSATAHAQLSEPSPPERNREQGREQGREKESAPPAAQAPARTPPPDEDPKWREFWYDAYPRKDGRIPALKAWIKATKVADPDVIIAGARAYAAQERHRRTPKEKIKMAEGWLNGQRWEDDHSNGRNGSRAAESPSSAARHPRTTNYGALFGTDNGGQP